MTKGQVLVAMVLITISAAAAQSRKQPAKSVAMLIARQSNSPASLTEATFGQYDLIEGAKLKNQGSKPIQAYKIGWIAFSRSGHVRHGSGMLIIGPSVIAPEESIKIPEQNFSPAILRKDVTRIFFYVAELHFSDGTNWKEKLDTLRRGLK